MGNKGTSPLYRAITSTNPLMPSKDMRNQEVEIAEVVDIILDESHPLADNNPANIGMAKIRRWKSDDKKSDESLGWAKPLWPNGGIYPLKHEMVIIVEGPKENAGVAKGASWPYYIGPVNVWGLNNYNVLPGTAINLAQAAQEESTGTGYANFSGNPPPQILFLKREKQRFNVFDHLKEIEQ